MGSRRAIWTVSVCLFAIVLSACAAPNAGPPPLQGAVLTVPSSASSSPATGESHSSEQVAEPVAASVLKETPAWFSLLPPTPEPAPTPEHAWLSLPMPTPELQQIVGGGIVEDGPFSFRLWIIKDSQFGHNPVTSSLYSDVEGRAVYMGWVYKGVEALSGPIFEYWGLPLPRWDALPSEYARAEPGWGGGRIVGIHFSPDFLPASSPPEGPIKVGFLLITPDGPYGACIQFTLTTDLKDVDPATIALGRLPCEESASLPAYPSPLPTREGTNLYVSAGCPNPEGAEAAASLTREEALEVLGKFYSGDPSQRRQVTDPAFWPVVPSEVEPLTLVEGNLSEPRPARESPYADLLAGACGERTLDYLWWVEVCPGSPPPDDFQQCPPALRLHYFLIRRGERWLIWGSG